MLSKRVSEVNIQTRLRVDEEAWPPEQPKTFTPLLLIQHQGHRNLKQSTAMTKFVQQGHIDKLGCSSKAAREHYLNKHEPLQELDSHEPLLQELDNHEPLHEVLNTSKVTLEVAEFLAPLETNNDPQFILIEGAPGIGKSLLLKEIAYRWGVKQILHKFKLVLLICLRDPVVHQISMINDLFQLFCRRDRRANEIATACSDYLLANNGKDLAFLFDGYDEYPEMLQKDSLIADILKRKELPHCGLIVSSRPHASVRLREQASVRVDILGFAEAEREHYIEESMKGQPHRINELTRYLQDHSTISSLCFIPFNIVVLIYLYKQGIPLPKNSAELYNYFICLAIYRHCVKHGHCLQNNITKFADFPKLTDLPEPYNTIIHQLSKLSLQAVNANKLIFTLDEIKSTCPDIATVPGAINGFGLLQAVEHFGLIGTITTFNFVHFSVQEYLAAHYIANLPADEELRIIEEKFWSCVHFNVFSMYIAITKGQHPSFKHFLCDGNKTITISDKFLCNKLQCFRLYSCFHKANDVDICHTIEQSLTVRNKVDLSDIRLMACNVDYVTVFLTTSFCREWTMLNLSYCYIQDHGLHILHHGLQYCRNVTINKLWMSYNGLTAQSSSMISDITVNCKVKVLVIDYSYTIGENKQLYSMLTNSSTMLQQLFMSRTKLSSKGAIDLFSALKNNNKLKQLHINHNAITDDASDAIITALERNSCLVTLFMYNNPLSGEAMVNIVNGLKANNTLEWLRLPRCQLKDVRRRISSLQEVINKKRESRGCQVKLRIYYS